MLYKSDIHQWEIICVLMGEDPNDKKFDNVPVEDLLNEFNDKYALLHEGEFDQLLHDLTKLIFYSKSPMTGCWYKGFGIDNGKYIDAIVQVEAEDPTQTGGNQ